MTHLLTTWSQEMLPHLKKLRQHQVSLPPLGAIIGSALSSCTLAYSRFPCICSSICIGACICKSFCICFAFSSISGRCASTMELIIVFFRRASIFLSGLLFLAAFSLVHLQLDQDLWSSSLWILNHTKHGWLNSNVQEALLVFAFATFCEVRQRNCHSHPNYRSDRFCTSRRSPASGSRWPPSFRFSDEMMIKVSFSFPDIF